MLIDRRIRFTDQGVQASNHSSLASHYIYIAASLRKGHTVDGKTTAYFTHILPGFLRLCGRMRVGD